MEVLHLLTSLKRNFNTASNHKTVVYLCILDGLHLCCWS